MSYMIRYLMYGAIGLVAMRVLAKRGLALLDRRVVTLLLLGSFALLLLVLVPGIGLEVNDARRWFAAGPIQFQPSELMKFAIVLYVARFLADHPKRVRSFRQAVVPVALVTGPACLLIVVEPDLGTALVLFGVTAMMLWLAGIDWKWLVGGVAAALPIVAGLLFFVAWRRARRALTLPARWMACSYWPPAATVTAMGWKVPVGATCDWSEGQSPADHS